MKSKEIVIRYGFWHWKRFLVRFLIYFGSMIDWLGAVVMSTCVTVDISDLDEREAEIIKLAIVDNLASDVGSCTMHVILNIEEKPQ